MTQDLAPVNLPTASSTSASPSPQAMNASVPSNPPRSNAYSNHPGQNRKWYPHNYHRGNPSHSSEPGSSKFVEIKLTDPQAQPHPASSPYELVLANGRRLRVAPDFQDQVLVRLLRVLEQVC